jgi:ribosomal 30S subunit maturation factor RimM
MNRLATFTAVAALAAAPAIAQGMATGKSFISSQSPEQHLASKLIGTSVTGPGDEKIGSINDLLLDKSGNTVAVVIGVGGFLGIGAKDVAIPFNAVNVMRTESGDKAVIQVSKTELEQAPAFKAYEPPRPAASQKPSGGPGTTRPTN